ncbi:hypothetical protein [Cellulomonas sp. KH9]|uniref:hypothetical protein n=1 Tax=Cellulomonas sp. KH9 TaxID=1855324 RepID=UPI0008DED3C7|nr:hypothetical protein [Cellulomonas sp. KH9]SFK29154.1 hypothetical protein SAMN05216467_2710 [Cellulomonas sp. KH9]
MTAPDPTHAVPPHAVPAPSEAPAGASSPPPGPVVGLRAVLEVCLRAAAVLLVMVAFAVAGGVLGGAALAAWGGGVAILVWAAVGAAVAGGARAWTGRARRRRALLRATHPGAPS